MSVELTEIGVIIEQFTGTIADIGGNMRLCGLYQNEYYKNNGVGELYCSEEAKDGALEGHFCKCGGKGDRIYAIEKLKLLIV